MSVQLKVDQELRLKIKKIGINGEGIANYKGRIVFVPLALPKEEVLVRVRSNSPKFTYASLVKIIKKSPERVTPECKIYHDCGGCQLQHMSYPAQLAFKKDILKQALQKFKPENYENYSILKPIGAKQEFHYRNKAQFQLAVLNGEIQAGLFKENSHQLVPLKDCLVQKEETQEIINLAVELLNQYNVPIYNERKKTDGVRSLMVRFAFQTQQAQLVFVSTLEKIPHHREIILELIEKYPNIKSIVLNVHTEKTSLFFGDKNIHLFGKESIEERLNDVLFDLSARAFFQLNPVQTSILYKEALKALAVEQNEKVVDAYCGVGTIGLSFAKEVMEVRGMDVIPSAIDDAKRNAARMNVENASYYTGKAEDLLPQWIKEGFEPTSIVVDPPRSGLDQKLIQAILESTANKLVYVSCNPSTLARDLVPLAKKFHVNYLQTVDMFPMTARSEVVVKLTRK